MGQDWTAAEQKSWARQQEGTRNNTGWMWGTTTTKLSKTWCCRSQCSSTGLTRSTPIRMQLHLPSGLACRVRMRTNTWIRCRSMATQVSSATDSSISRTWIPPDKAIPTDPAKTTLTRARRLKWLETWVETTWCRTTTVGRWTSSSKWVATAGSTATSCPRATSSTEDL